MAYDVNFRGFIDVCRTVINDVVRALNNDDMFADLVETSVIRLNALWRNIGRMTRSYPQCDSLIPLLQRLINYVEERQSSLTVNSGITLRMIETAGRPRYYISRNHLLFFVEMGFSAKHMARLLHISVSSIQRRLRSFGISLRRRYTEISDSELDVRVQRITQFNRSLGQRLVQGTLASEGVVIQRSRVAQSLIRVDEAGVAIRWARTIHRRSYNVSGPNALWHVDGNHKLIRWGMVIHGAIDGFSRMVTYLNIVLDNSARTALKPFLKACEEHGIPSRVRTDHGLENLDIATFMIAHRGVGRGSIITGRSVHNQRIERLWRDMFQSCTFVFYKLFHFLEENGHLDVNNALHLWCLQYIYIPRIQVALSVFKEAWNNHRLRTEHGNSPLQVFVSGVLSNVGQGHCEIDELFSAEIGEQSYRNYGIDWNGPVPEATNNETVIVSPLPCPLSQERLNELYSTINPLENKEELGIDLYIKTITYCLNEV